MATEPLKRVVHHLFHVVARSEFEPYTDQQLLQRYTDERDEYAFGELIRRHRGMVWSACWRVLGQCQDTEDAFQATFVLLFRKVAGTHWRASVEGWLYHTARQTATKIKVSHERRRAREERRAAMYREASEGFDYPWEWTEMLDKEIERLPVEVQDPIILCYLEGMTQEQAARRLNISTRRVKWLLERGRKKLRERLARHGLDGSVATMLAELSPQVMLREAPAGLVERTLDMARILKESNGVLETVGISPQVATLVKGAMGMTLKMKVLLGSMLLSLVVVGAGAAKYTSVLHMLVGEQRQEGKTEINSSNEEGPKAKKPQDLFLAVPSPTNDIPPSVMQAEKKRIALISKVQPAVVAIVSQGGSGVIISEDGYVLTCYHVVAGASGYQCGLSNGKLYDAVLVGWDRVGDVALIKMLPEKKGDKFPYVQLSDSDKVKAGDWSLAMGNPRNLSTDFTPSVSYGLISGVHRYQYPSNTLGNLEYGDCIQVDTAINPGNSGGPLFNMAGELIGINGRGSFAKRGRVNSGAGYAISTNQIKNFLGHFRAGQEVDHATLGAMIETDRDTTTPRLVVSSVLDDCDVRRRGLEVGDELISFADRPMTTVNEFKNVLSIYPRDWRLPLVFRHGSERKETLVRLMGASKRDLNPDTNVPRPPNPGRQIAPPKGSISKLYRSKPGFANYHFNRTERKRLLDDFAKHGDFSTLDGEWILKAEGQIRGAKNSAEFGIREVKSADGKETKTVVRYSLGGIDLYELDPLQQDILSEKLKDPPGSGGLLVALFQYRQLLTQGYKGFSEEFTHAGVEPFYLPVPLGQEPDYAKLRIDCEVIRTRLAGIPAKWYFSVKDHTLVGFEVFTSENLDDPCEVYLSDYKKVDGRLFPHHMEVRYGGKAYPDPNAAQTIFANLHLKSIKIPSK